MNYIIRKTKIEDMRSVEDAHRSSIKDVCSKDYTPDQIKNFSLVKYTEDRWKNSIENEFHIVVELDGKIEGMCHAKIHENGVGEIVGLYFTKKILGIGIGKQVVERAFEYLDKYNPSKVILTGTVTARPFYERMGFKVVQEKKIDIRGVDIECFQMEKLLLSN